MADTRIPGEALQALEMMRELLGGSVVAVYLYGSAVMGGLHKDSDVDLMAVVCRGLSEKTRRDLAQRLMVLSGRMGNADNLRPLEVTVVNREDIVPWRYPPKKEFIYGEWLRSAYERGPVPEPMDDPDLAILLSQIRSSSIALVGEEAPQVLAPVPAADLKRAMKDCLPDLMYNLKGDERNVILTLARMWVTAESDEFVSKDEAAKRVIPRLPKEMAPLLALAGKAYRGEAADRWEGLNAQAAALASYLKKEIEERLT